MIENSIFYIATIILGLIMISYGFWSAKRNKTFSRSDSGAIMTGIFMIIVILIALYFEK